VSLDVGHQRDAPVGHAVELKNLGSSLFGSFRIHNTSAGDEALDRIQDGTLTSVSIRFTPLASRDVDGVRQHRRAYLDSVALTATPVYPQATIVGVRKGSRREASDPSARERVVLDVERLDQKLGALMSAHFEEWFEQRQLGRRLVQLGIRTCRCGQLIEPGQPWHLDHRDDRRGYLGPSHATCNLRAAAEKTNGKRRDHPLIWSRVWFEPIPPNVILSRDLDAD
jgi:hypothetical protein